jgi:hypothetical protein
LRENGKLLDWEDDIDISILLNEDTTWERLSTQLFEQGERDGYFVNIFQGAGLVTVSFDAPRPWPFR